MPRPPAHCQPTENVLPFPKRPCLWPAPFGKPQESGDEAPHRARAQARQDAVPLRCTLSLPHSIASPRNLALSKSHSHGSAPPPFRRRPLSASFPVRWCARLFGRSSSTGLRSCRRPRPCPLGIITAHHAPWKRARPFFRFDGSGRTASLSRPRHHAQETPVGECSAPQSQARQDFALPSPAFPNHKDRLTLTATVKELPAHPKAVPEGHPPLDPRRTPPKPCGLTSAFQAPAGEVGHYRFS